MKNVSLEQVARKIKEENPWWETGKSNSKWQKLRPRPYLNGLYSLVAKSQVQRAVILMGPRRVGKTVLIDHLIARLLQDGVNSRQILYVSIDIPLYTGLSLEDFIEQFQALVGSATDGGLRYIFFDEIQYLRNWEQQLKVLVDQYPNIRFLVSGSAAAALRLKSIESGAGRFTEFLLPPLTFHEYLVLKGVDISLKAELNGHFINYINFGGYPEVALSEEIQNDPGRFVKSDIIDKVLLRDLPSLYGIQDVQELNRLFTMLAYNTANEVSLEELSKNAGVAKNTLKRYIDYLEAAFLIKVVYRVDENARQFKRATRFKVYLTNPSMRAALFSPVDEEDTENMGALVETAVFAQWFHAEKNIYYARWGGKNGGEVDLIQLDAAQRISWVTEVKWTDRCIEHPEELKSLRTFCANQSVGWADVTTRTKSGLKEVDGIKFRFIPAAEYALQIGLTS
jgi:predicted AAA+ superfamily ATPase